MEMSVFNFLAGPEEAGLQHLVSGNQASGFDLVEVSFLNRAKFQLLHRTRALDDMPILLFT